MNVLSSARRCGRSAAPRAGGVRTAAGSCGWPQVLVRASADARVSLASRIKAYRCAGASPHGRTAAAASPAVRLRGDPSLAHGSDSPAPRTAGSDSPAPRRADLRKIPATAELAGAGRPPALQLSEICGGADSRGAHAAGPPFDPSHSPAPLSRRTRSRSREGGRPGAVPLDCPPPFSRRRFCDHPHACRPLAAHVPPFALQLLPVRGAGHRLPALRSPALRLLFVPSDGLRTAVRVRPVAFSSPAWHLPGGSSVGLPLSALGASLLPLLVVRGPSLPTARSADLHAPRTAALQDDTGRAGERFADLRT